MATMRMKVIKPRGLNERAMLAELQKEMKAIHGEVSKDFDSTVKTWDNKPKFTRKFESNQRRIRFFTGTADEIYGYVSSGTRPHRIRPKRAKMLAFPGTFKSKTVPGTIPSRAGGSSGETVYSKGVMHPGSKGREFPEAIAKKWGKPFPKRIQSAMQRARIRSGHAT